MGYASEIIDWVTVLVREHLTLSEYATGKDPNDPAVAEELADRLHHNKLLLDMLFDLTRADGSSLGATPARASPNNTAGPSGVNRLCMACTQPCAP